MRKIEDIRTIKANENHKNMRLDTFLSETLKEYTRSHIQKLIEENLVEIVDKKKTKCGNKLQGNETIKVTILEDEILDIIAENIDIDIIYEDSDIVIINKNPNMVVHPSVGHHNGTLVNAIMYHISDLSTINGVIRPGIVHRLDKNTSGLLIVAKNNSTHIKLTDMFKNREIKKTYLAICNGNFKEKQGQIKNFIGRSSQDRKKMTVSKNSGKLAITNYKVITEVEHFTLLQIGLETGRTHQIRVHMKYLNHPILGDDTYGKVSKIADRQMLHAYKLEFYHPITGEKLEIISDLPEDFQSVLEKLDLKWLD